MSDNVKKTRFGLFLRGTATEPKIGALPVIWSTANFQGLFISKLNSKAEKMGENSYGIPAVTKTKNRQWWQFASLHKIGILHLCYLKRNKGHCSPLITVVISLFGTGIIHLNKINCSKFRLIRQPDCLIFFDERGKKNKSDELSGDWQYTLTIMKYALN